jgi:hypothetical protein
LPGRGGWPGLDDHLVEPVVTRDEMIGGVRAIAHPAHPPHADQHTDLDYILRAHAAPGYRASSDLLTRHDEDSDFASDACLRREGTNPETGGRYLEEMAFEIVSTENEKHVTEKARRMHRRGVRRIFTIWTRDPRLREWSAESQSWRPVDPASRIEDPCLAVPIEVAALLDAALADDAVAEALAAKGNPVLEQREAEAEARGEIRGEARAILKVLEARGIAVSEAQAQEILGCRDLDRLDRRLSRAIQALSAGEILSEA